MQSVKQKSSKRLARTVLLAGVLLVIAAGGVAWAMLHHKAPKQVAIIPAAPSRKITDPGKQSAPADSTSSKPVPTDSTPKPLADFIAPVGSFVNNHHPNLSGSPAPNAMESNCHTTPGATCQITFTKDNSVKKLESKIADADGNVTWQWKLQDAGVSEGTWNISAIASSGSNSKSTDDPMAFEVRQ